MQDLFILTGGLAGGLRMGCPRLVVPGQLIPMECDNGRHHHETNLGCLVVDYDYAVGDL